MVNRAIIFGFILSLSGLSIAYADVAVPRTQISVAGDQSMTQYIQSLQENVHEAQNVAALQEEQNEEANAAVKLHNPVLPPTVPGNIKRGPTINAPPPNPYLAPNPWSNTTTNPWAPPTSPAATPPESSIHSAPPVTAPNVVPNIFGPNTNPTNNQSFKYNSKQQQTNTKPPQTIPGNIYQ